MRLTFITMLLIALFISLPVMALEISPDGPRIVHLKEDAASVIVGNPLNATVTIDNPRMLVINAGVPGLTKLTVLGRDGKAILNENLVVNGAGAQNLIRVRNACINGGDNCQPTRMFHCEAGEACHNVIVNEASQSGNGGGSSAQSAGVSGSAPSVSDAAIDEGIE